MKVRSVSVIAEIGGIHTEITIEFETPMPQTIWDVYRPKVSFNAAQPSKFFNLDWQITE